MRRKLIGELAYQWRMAENDFLITGSDILKGFALEAQDRAKLTKEEIKELEDLCQSMGI